MGKGIIIDDNHNRRKMLALNFELYLDVKLESMTNSDSAIEYLKAHDDIQLIVCKNNVGDESTILKTFYYVKSNNLEFPILCLGSCTKLSGEENVKVVEDLGTDLKPIISWMAKKLAVTAEMMAWKDTEEYYPISIRNFSLLAEAPCDIFSLIDQKYEVLIKKGAPISKDTVNQWIFDKKKELFVKSLDRLKFVNNLTLNASKILNAKTTQRGERINATQTVFEESRNVLTKIGLNEKSIKLADSAINSMITIAKGTNELAELLALLESSGSSYLYKHSVLSATLGHHCVSSLPWGSSAQKEAICFVAFFHDIVLTQDAQAKINSNRALKESSLSDGDKKIVETHAFKASQLIQDYPAVPFGTPEIILQHHGMANGIGFSPELNSRITPLAAVFQVVEYFVDLIIATPADAKFDFEANISLLHSKYKKGHYQ